MERWVRFGAVLAVGWAGAALWAYGAAGPQPVAAGSWAVLLAVGAVLAGFARRWSVAGLAAVWIGADLLLDRVDLGRPALLPAAIFAGGLVTAAAVRLREPAPQPRRAWPGAGWVAAASMLGAATAVVVLDAPAGAEPQLPPARLAAFGLLAVAVAALAAVAALVSALSALPIGIGFGLVAVAAFGAALAWVVATVATELRAPAPCCGPAEPVRPPVSGPS